MVDPETIEFMRQNIPHWDELPYYIQNLALYGQEEEPEPFEDELPVEMLQGLEL